MPPNTGEAYWSPEGAVLAMTDGRSVFLSEGPLFRTREVLQFPQPLLEPIGDQMLFWSPDGAFLAVQNREHLWVIEAAAGQPLAEVLLSTEHLAPWWDVCVDWYPDGSQLTYNDSRGLWMLDVAAGRSTLLYASEDPVSGAVRSPSGRFLAFTTHWASGTGVHDIYVLDQEGDVYCTWPIENGWFGGLGGWLDDETLRWGERCGTGCSYMGILDVTHCQEMLFTGFGYRYLWRSAGDYAALAVDGHSDQAYLMDREGDCWPLGGSPDPGGSCVGSPSGSVGALASIHHYPLDWSPDGHQLLLVSTDYSQSPHAPTCDLWAIAVPGLSHTHLLSDSCYGKWSPDGQLIAFFAQGKPILDEGGRMIGTEAQAAPGAERGHLGVLDLATQKILLVLSPVGDTGSFPVLEHYPRGRWSRDSRHLLVADDAGNLYLWRRGESMATVVCEDLPQFGCFWRWSADSSSFFLTTGARTWIVRLEQ